MRYHGKWRPTLRLEAGALREGGFDPASILALAGEQEVKHALKRHCDQAIERCVFGAPTFFVADEMFFGQDRLEFVAEALDAQWL